MSVVIAEIAACARNMPRARHSKDSVPKEPRLAGSDPGLPFRYGEAGNPKAKGGIWGSGEMPAVENSHARGEGCRRAAENVGSGDGEAGASPVT